MQKCCCCCGLPVDRESSSSTLSVGPHFDLARAPLRDREELRLGVSIVVGGRAVRVVVIRVPGRAILVAVESGSGRRCGL